MLALIIQLISGAVGGNVVGALLKDLNLGTLWNSTAGIVGGGLGGQILGALGAGGTSAAAASGSMDLNAILASVGGGAAGGGVLMAVVAFIKKAMGGSAAA